MGSAPLAVDEAVINPTNGHDHHNHPESDEVLVISEGQSVQTVDDSQFLVGPGGSICILRGTMHSTFNTGWKQMRLLAIYCLGGAETALRSLPDYARLAPGATPVWEHG